MRLSADRFLRGGYPRLPGLLDACSDAWSGLRPRARTGVMLLAVIALLGTVDARVRSADARWGGPPRGALIAETDLPVGAPATGFRQVTLPPAAVPDTAVSDVQPGRVLSLALPRGAVLTRAHLDPRGPAAGLAAGLRAVPVPAEEGWAVTAGGWVDVWVLGAGDQPARLVAASRPVVAVRRDTVGLTALVGLQSHQVGPTTAGLALGRVLLAHAHPAEAPRPPS